MKSRTRDRLLLAAVVALVLVLVGWYITLPRPTYAYANTLTQIDFVPPPTSGAVLTYSFSAPLTVGVSGGAVDPAFLRSFTVTGVSPPSVTVDVADSLVAALLQGGQEGGTPFVPAANPSLTTLSTSSVPAEIVSYPPMTVSGFGTMAFVTS